MCMCFHSCIFTPAKSNMNPPGNKDPLIVISLIKAGQLQRWQCWLRQRSGSAQQRQRSVSTVSASAAAVVASVSTVAAAAQRQRQPQP